MPDESLEEPVVTDPGIPGEDEVPLEDDPKEGAPDAEDR